MYVDARHVAEAIDDEAIRALRTEAATASDHDQVALCDLATDGSIWPDDHRNISAAMAVRLGKMTQQQARVACARAIAEAKARQ